MRIADTTLFYTAGGGGVRTYVDCKRHALLARPDMEHKVIMPAAGFQAEGDFIGLPALPLPLAPGYRFPLRTHYWARVMAGLQPDIIEAEDPYTPAWAAQEAARMLDVPAVGFYHSDLLTLIHNRITPALDAATRHYLKKLYSGFDLVLTPSRVMAARLNACGIEDVRVQPLGVDLKTFNPSRANPLARRQLGIDADKRLLVFAGRGAREKHIPLLLEALQRLGPDYHLLLIGTGMPEQTPDNVSVIRRFCDKSEVARWMAAADALVHAGDQETFGLVALEAMASGLPVVCVRAGALPEVVPESCGVLAEPGSARAMADAVDELFRHGDPAAMGLAARRHARRYHSWDGVVDSLLGHYREVLGTRESATVAEAHEQHP